MEVKKIPKLYIVHYIDHNGIFRAGQFKSLSRALFDCYYWLDKLRVFQIKIYIVDDYYLHQIAEINR